MTAIAIRAVDLVGALLLLVVAAVPMLLIAAAIRLHDGGPALFRQTRVGVGGRHFTVYKFRSMRIDGDGSGSGTATADESLNAAKARFRNTRPGDPRITPVGRFLRPSHLDELPQLLNILAGDMSFVGVRPDTPVQEADYPPEYWRLRHRYKPGLTGPAQLRSDSLDLAGRSAEERRWISGYGLAMYFSTLLRTFCKVLKRSSF